MEDVRHAARLVCALGCGALAALLSMALVLIATDRNPRRGAVPTPTDPPAEQDDVALLPVRRVQGHRAGS